MLFYEDFIKSINSKNNVEMKKIEKFSLEMKRIISGAGIGIPLVLAGPGNTADNKKSHQKMHVC